MRMLLPLLVVLLAAAAGAGAGLVLRPAPEAPAAAPPADSRPREFARLPNQFVVPLLEGGQVRSLVILSLTVETVAGGTDAVFSREPKLRDAFLQVLFDHANAGGFRGAFTAGSALGALRDALREAAVRIAGNVVLDVLIVDIARQDA